MPVIYLEHILSHGKVKDLSWASMDVQSVDAAHGGIVSVPEADLQGHGNLKFRPCYRDGVQFVIRTIRRGRPMRSDESDCLTGKDLKLLT